MTKRHANAGRTGRARCPGQGRVVGRHGGAAALAYSSSAARVLARPPAPTKARTEIGGPSRQGGGELRV